MNPERLKEMLKMWHHVKLKHNADSYMIIYSTNGEWDFFWQGRVYIDSDIKQYFTDEYEIVTPCPKLLQPWDKCVVLENIRELAEKEWRKDKIKWEMIGKGGYEIGSSSNQWYNIFNENKSYRYDFPHRALAPYYEEESNRVEIDTVKEWQELTVEIDGKKVKAKILSVECGG